MPRFAFRALVLFTLTLFLAAPVSAAGYDQKDLLGTWNGDVLAMLEEAGMLGEMPPGVDVEAMAAMFSFVLTFTEDEVTMTNAGPHGEMTHTNDYEVVKADGDVVTLKSVDEDGEEQKVTVTFSGRDAIAVDTGEEDAPVMKFTRAPAAAEKKD